MYFQLHQSVCCGPNACMPRSHQMAFFVVCFIWAVCCTFLISQPSCCGHSSAFKTWNNLGPTKLTATAHSSVKKKTHFNCVVALVLPWKIVIAVQCRMATGNFNILLFWFSFLTLIERQFVLFSSCFFLYPFFFRVFSVREWWVLWSCQKNWVNWKMSLFQLRAGLILSLTLLHFFVTDSLFCWLLFHLSVSFP